MTGAAAAGLGFGVFYTSFSRVGTDAGMLPIVTAKMSAVSVLAVAAVLARQRLAPQGAVAAATNYTMVLSSELLFDRAKLQLAVDADRRTRGP